MLSNAFFLLADAKPLIAPLVELVGATAANLIVAVVVVALAAALGAWMSKQFRMPDHGWKFGLVLFSLLAGAAITYLGWPPKLGIDLSGGVILVYQVDQTQKKDEGPTDMQAMVAAVARRVNPDGLKEVTIRPYGEEQLEIIVPKATDEEVEQIKNTVTNLGTLEFRILANRRDSRHQDVIRRAEATPGQIVIDEAQQRIGRWVPLAKGRTENLAQNPDFVSRAVGDHHEILVVLDPYNVTGDYLNLAAEGHHPETGKPVIDFSFNVAGAQKFGSLTTENQPDARTGLHRNLAILLDNVVTSAPTLNQVITSRGFIEGDFTPAEIQEYVTTLRAGKLPAVLEKQPSSQMLTGPTLGADTIRTSRAAMIISTLLVLAFLLVYYRFAGIVACFALLLNLLLVVSIMIVIHAAFTLPGLAGLVLTIGMAVDANILIFERMREEQAKGATLRMTIRNGFSRAMSAIIDSNVTTLISAVILYVIGTDQVKGFAVTMFLGILLSMFTGVFCSRVVFDLAERLGLIDKVRMMRLLTTTNIDFYAWRKPAIIFSLIVFALGAASVIGRGTGLWGIDFLGGTRVELAFTEPQDIANVRRGIEEANKLEDVTVSDISIAGEETGTRFMVDTTERDQAVVKKALTEIFQGKLETNALTEAQVSAIAATATTPAATTPDATAPTDAGQDGDGSSGAAEAQEAPPQPESPPTSSGEPPTAEPPSEPETSPGAPPSTTETSETVPDLFAGGSQVDLTFAKPIHHDALQAMVAAEIEKIAPGRRFALANPDYVAGGNARFDKWQLKIDAPVAAAEQVVASIHSQVDGQPLFPSSANIGGSVASNTKEQAIYGLIASCLSIVVYLWVRFQKLAYGVAAVVALVHDVAIMLAALAGSYYIARALGPAASFLMIDPFKIDLPIVAAFLTIIGFSVNDTIVIFDRIRELKGKSPYVTPAIINQAVNQTLSRTILTFFTAFLTVTILFIFGGSSIHGFAFAMLVGLISGTYSTVYIASPVLLWMGEGKPEPVKEARKSEPAAA